MAKLTAQVPAWDVAGGGGRVEFDGATCAALCANLSRRYYLAARLKWCLDWSVATELETLLLIEARVIASEEKWRVPKGREYVRRMAGLALAEMAHPGMWREQQRKAGYVGMDPAEWCRTWRSRYEAVYREAEDWAGIAWRHMRRQAVG